MDLEKNIQGDSGGDNNFTGPESLSATKSPNVGHRYPHGSDGLVVDPMDLGEVEVINIRQGNKLLRSLRDYETWMDRKLNFEAMGVERIPENKRKPPQNLNASAPLSVKMMFLWFSFLFSPSLIPVGVLGPLFGLSVHTSAILTVFGTLTGALAPAFTATLGPPTGLRQIAVSRYAFGIWGAKLCGLLNIIVNAGYAVIASILGGQLLTAISDGHLPLEVGIVIIVVVAFVISFFGFAIIHHYERYAWVVAFVLLCVLWGQSARYFSPTPGLNSLSGMDYSGACLSYFAVIFGTCCAWCPLAADYYVHYPVHTNKWLVFGLTYAGICVPTIFVTIQGNYFGGIIESNTVMATIYHDGGIGALILASLRPSGWAKFACVVFFLSFLGNLIANIYSSALSFQLWGRHFIAVPRFVWCAVISAITLALALGGRDKLEAIINNLLPILGYWTLAFASILFIEHYWFRPRLGGYDLSAWQDQKRMPWGVAGTGAFLIGIGFSFLGMDQTWYIAPVAKKIGTYGGDVANELTLVSVLVFYPILRAMEIRLVGR